MVARRVGDEIIRQRHRGSCSCNRLLTYLHSIGFTAVPKPVGIDHNRERVGYVEGTVPDLPLPEWALTDQVLEEVARLLRSYHEAVRSFPQRSTDRWKGKAPEGFEGDIICHQDPCPSNVVFVNGRPAALIDFEFAGPAHFLWDVALAARNWVPLKDPEDLDPGLKGLNLVRRFVCFCDAYGVERHDRGRVIEGAIISLDLGLHVVRKQVERGDVLYQILWFRGYEGVNRRTRYWIENNRGFLVGEW